ncbi:MAG: diguanylate cyclase [Azoarcus sp.]|jgi:diguanylate cyclase (GGDEF)-like protein|nr:diguanylate cyclase [Azoarcus sp.]
MPTPIDLNRFAQIKATGHLPSPRGVALAVMRIAHDETVSTVELAQTIKVDPAFVGRLIKAANGALFRQRPIVSVQEALMMVGIPAVRAMALGFSLLSNYRKGACAEFDYMRFWSSSVIMALTTQALAARMRMIAADELFSVGLLAQIGELALATVYPDKYGQLLKEAAAGGDLPKLEKQILAMTHADLSAAMLMDWGLPPVFTEPVRYFECPADAPFGSDGREMVVMQCLILARCVADICLAKPDEQRALLGKAVRQAAHLGCARDVFIRDCKGIACQWLEWSRLLQLDGVEIPSFDVLSGVEPDVQEPKTLPAESEPSEKSMPHVEAASGVRALVVTGDVAVRKHLLKVLDEMDIKAFEYFGQNGFMERILDLQPQILLLDVGENAAHIVRMVRTLRASRLGRGMYILQLSSSDEKHITADDAGMDDFFVKGSGDKVLRARLDTARRVVLLQQELEREREELRRFAAELAISNRSLQEAALTDSLTGLPNRRYAIERIQQEWGASERNVRPLACMVIDLDNFKQINDLYGHDVGDIALRFASESLRRVLRGQDVICRMGGDEFLVICPEASQRDALVCAERLRKEIEQLTVNNEEDELRLSVSIGVAVRDESMASADDLIKKADGAVFSAKRLGRNRVVPDFSMDDVQKQGGRTGGGVRRA